VATVRDHGLLAALLRDAGTMPPGDLRWCEDLLALLPAEHQPAKRGERDLRRLLREVVEAAVVATLVDSISLRDTADSMLRHRLAVLRARVEERG
jgi:hypothetical protein